VDSERFPRIVSSIYDLVHELEAMFPGRHFTPDGHMLGSLGEAIASFHYGITLLPASAFCHDGECRGRQVQIKATQTSRVSISSEPEHLLVLHLHPDGSFDEIYNGPGNIVWNLVAHKPRPKNGQYQLPISRLRQLMGEVPYEQRLGRRQA